MSRTTLVLTDRRLVELKKLAAARQQTLSSLVDEFLRQGLERAHRSRKAAGPVHLPTFAMGKPLVNIDDRDQLYDALDGP